MIKYGFGLGLIVGYTVEIGRFTLLRLIELALFRIFPLIPVRMWMRLFFC